MGWYDTVLFPFKWIMAWIMVAIHKILVILGMPTGPGATWIVTLVVLTLFVNFCIIPLYLKQIHSSRGMSVIQPQMTKIKEKYKGRNDAVSKQQMQQETMALYREHGVNPMASCLPLLIQLPVMMALYRVLWQVPQIAHNPALEIGGFDQHLANDMENTSLFGLYLSDTFSQNNSPGIGKIIIIVSVILYVSLMFVQQLAMIKWNMSDNNPQQAQMMKMTAYIFPFMSLWIGFIVQFGLLIYLVITMLFGFVRQMLIIYYLPNPDTKAHKKLLERNSKKFEIFKKEIKESTDQALREIGIEESDLVKAQKIAMKHTNKNGADSDVSVAFEKVENGENLLKALEIYRQSQEKLHKKAQDLELEAKPKKKGKKSFFLKAMEQAQQNGQTVNTTTRLAHNQPKKVSRSKRDTKNKGRLSNSEKITSEKIEKSRKARKNLKNK